MYILVYIEGGFSFLVLLLPCVPSYFFYFRSRRFLFSPSTFSDFLCSNIVFVHSELFVFTLIKGFYDLSQKISSRCKPPISTPSLKHSHKHCPGSHTVLHNLFLTILLRVDPLHSTVTINSPLPLQHYNGPNAHINSANNNYAYYYHHPNNNDNNNNNNNNHSNNINYVLPAVNIQISNNSHYRNTHQIPSAPQRLVSIIPDPHMPPNISHFQLNNIHPQMHAPVATDIHFQQVPVYNKTNNGIGIDNINNDKPVNSNQNEVLDNIDEHSCHEINRVVSFSKHFENNELTTTANDLNIQSTMDELAKLKSLSNSTHFRQSIATQNFHSLQNHITTIENRLASLLTDRQQEQQQLKQQESEKESSSPFSNKIKLPSLQELTDSISTQHLPTFYDNKRHASDTDLKSSTLHGPLYHRHAFLSTSSSSPSPRPVPCLFKSYRFQDKTIQTIRK